VALAEENLARARTARAAQVARLQADRRRRAARIDDHCRSAGLRPRWRRRKARAAEAERKAAGPEADRQGPGPVRNITDPDSRLMPVRGGVFIQGYNAQNMTSGDGPIIATELTGDPADCPWFGPMTGQVMQAAALIRAHRPGGGIGQVLADAGYCSEANLTCPGLDRSSPPVRTATWKRPPAARKAPARTGAARPPRLCASG
jgi:hypothetical protein